MARPDLSSCAMLFSRDITDVVFHSNRIVFPRRSPARTNAPAGAKTGQTQHFAGAQFTRLQFELRHLRVSAENGGISRKLRKTRLPKARALRGGFPFIYAPFAAPKDGGESALTAPADTACSSRRRTRCGRPLPRTPRRSARFRRAACRCARARSGSAC